MKRVADSASDLAQPMYAMMAVFGSSALYVVAVLVRRMAELATDWRSGGSWHVGVAHVIVSCTAFAMLFAAFVGAWRKVRG